MCIRDSTHVFAQYHWPQCCSLWQTKPIAHVLYTIPGTWTNIMPETLYCSKHPVCFRGCCCFIANKTHPCGAVYCKTTWCCHLRFKAMTYNRLLLLCIIFCKSVWCWEYKNINMFISGNSCIANMVYHNNGLTQGPLINPVYKKERRKQTSVSDHSHPVCYRQVFPRLGDTLPCCFLSA